jgi:hypothetical protein
MRPCRKENATHIHDNCQFVNAVSGSDSCLVWGSYKIHKLCPQNAQLFNVTIHSSLCFKELIEVTYYQTDAVPMSPQYKSLALPFQLICSGLWLHREPQIYTPLLAGWFLDLYNRAQVMEPWLKSYRAIMNGVKGTLQGTLQWPNLLYHSGLACPRNTAKSLRKSDSCIWLKPGPHKKKREW